MNLEAHAPPGCRVNDAANSWIEGGRVGGGRVGGLSRIDWFGHGRESSIGRTGFNGRAGLQSPASIERAGCDPLRFVAVRAALFDWDGTLVDTLPFMYAATEIVMAEYGVTVTWDEYRRHFTPDWRLLYRRFRLPEEAIESVGERWWSLYRGRDEAALLPGAAEALRRLAGAGLALGIVTAGRRESVEPQLERHGLGGLLRARVYGDDPFEQKPGPGGLRHALEVLGLAEHAVETAYVGDALDDMRLAVAVGARGIGIRSDLATDTELHDAGASEVMGSVADWVASLLG